jgi:hypothetical protein
MAPVRRPADHGATLFDTAESAGAVAWRGRDLADHGDASLDVSVARSGVMEEFA